MGSIEEARAQFPSAQASIYFDHAAAGPISIAVADAVGRFTEEHCRAGFQPTWGDAVERTRAQVARLVGGTTDHVAFVQNTSHGISIAANGFEWIAGDNVVVPELEFPTNFYPWMNLATLGVELRRVAAPAGHSTVADIASAIDNRTRVVAVSAVQYTNGHRYDLHALGQLCHERDVLLVVDGTQAVGAMSVDVRDCAIDLLAVSSHKWMLGPHGIGFVHLSDRALERLRPSVVGWLSVAHPFRFEYELDMPGDATRFEPGTENFAGVVGLGATVGLIERFGRSWIEQRLLDLTDHLCESLAASGARVVSERGDRSRSGIVVFRDDRVPNDVLHGRLREAGVRCSVRGGGVRFSPHYYNTVEEVDAALAAIA